MMEKVDVHVAKGKLDELIVAALSGEVIWIVSDASMPCNWYRPSRRRLTASSAALRG